MAVQSTTLSVLINRAKRWQAISRAEDSALVRDFDAAIRANKRITQFPWTLQKGSLKVFADVLEYPVPSDYDELAYIDTPKNANFYPARARFKFTSLQQFYENLDYRNDLAEIRDGNEVFLGVRFRPSGVNSQLLNQAEVNSEWSVSDDATAVANEKVIFKEGNGSQKITIVNSADLATIKNTFNSFTDGNYKQKFHFKLVYLDAIPTSIDMRFQVDDDNYIATNVTTQFSGQPFKADSWNLIAHDLNEATEVGTISTASVWASEKTILNGAATGTYYADTSYLRQWSLLDLYYYSRFNIALVGSTTANQEYFMNASEVFSSDSKLIGDSEWADVIQYDGMLRTLADLKETETLTEIKRLRQEAWDALALSYPSMRPLIITQKYRFVTDFNASGGRFHDVS